MQVHTEVRYIICKPLPLLLRRDLLQIHGETHGKECVGRARKGALDIARYVTLEQNAAAKKLVLGFVPNSYHYLFLLG
jgi:hypothetical protein